MRRRAARPAALPLFAALAALSLLGGCNAPWSENSDRPETARDFPPADRPVAPITSTKWSTEEARDRVNEADDNRVARERLDNVSLKLGAVDDPRLPAASFDRVFMVHMYHEIGEPYAFLWRLRPALRQGGQVIVVDGDRPIAQHGTPFRLLVCEFEAVGFKLLSYDDKAHAGGYLARFVPDGQRPAPNAIKVCKNP